MKTRLFAMGGIAILLLAAATWIALDAIRIRGIKVVKSHPEEAIPGSPDKVLLALETGEKADVDELLGACKYVRGRYDCADFRLQSMLRIMYLYPDRLDEVTKAEIKRTLVGFRYWMDQPGNDGMCFWSENHQILFAAAEYLAGKLYPEEVFTNDRLSGRRHMELARERLLAWMEQRWLYGFTEWYSLYYVEDIAPLANLVDLSGDREIETKASIILDLLLYDIGTQSFKGVFAPTSGRARENGKKGGAGDMRSISAKVWGYDHGPSEVWMDLNFVFSRKYKVPAAVDALAGEGAAAEAPDGARGVARAVEIKASSGLNLTELKTEGLLGQGTAQIMMQFAMESFTSPETISNAVTYFHRTGMFSNEFCQGLAVADIGL